MTLRRAFPCAVVVVALGLLATSCSKDGAWCTTPLGAPRTDTVALDGAVSALEVYDRVEVHWWPEGPTPLAVLHAWEGTADGVRIDSDADVLRIESVNRCAWVRQLDAVPRVDLYGVMPHQIQLESQADFIMKAPWRGAQLTMGSDEMAGDVDVWFVGDSLRLRLPNGIGHAVVRGEARRFSSFRSGFGDLDATALQAGQVMVHHAGLGAVRLRPEGYLFLELAGAGQAILEGPGDEWDIHVLPGATGTVVTTP